MTTTTKQRTPVLLDRPLPSSEDAERVILGAILLDNRIFDEAAERLTPDDLYSQFHRSVFAAMNSVHREGRPIEAIHVGEVMKRSGNIEQSGGITAIANLTFGLPHFSEVSQYITTVKKHAVIRRLIRTCSTITSEALAGESDADDILINAQTRINEISVTGITNASDDGFIPLAQVVHDEVIPALSDLRERKTRKISTGFNVIDRAIGGGLSTSDMMLLAGLPSSGKSALAIQTAFNIAQRGIPTAFLAGEMTNRENVFRIISQISRITNLNSVEHLDEHEFNDAVQYAVSIQDHPFYLDQRTADMHTLGTRLRSLVRLKGVKVLVVDYIQLLKIEKLDKRKRFERITEASQELKRLANELDIAIICVAQFNREGAKSGKPAMHDLEGAGQLEKDASIIMIIDRDETNSSFVDIRVVKGRNSGVSKFAGRFYSRCVRFEFDDVEEN